MGERKRGGEEEERMRVGEGGNKERKQARPGFKPRISCLVDLCLNYWAMFL